MSYRAVLRLTEHTETIERMEAFLAQARELGAGPRTKVAYMADPSGRPVLVIELPEKAAEAFEKAATPKRATKAQQAVRGQLEARDKAVRAKQPVPGHVKPVAKQGKVIVRRKKSAGV